MATSDVSDDHVHSGIEPDTLLFRKITACYRPSFVHSISAKAVAFILLGQVAGKTPSADRAYEVVGMG